MFLTGLKPFGQIRGWALYRKTGAPGFTALMRQMTRPAELLVPLEPGEAQAANLTKDAGRVANSCAYEPLAMTAIFPTSGTMPATTWGFCYFLLMKQLLHQRSYFLSTVAVVIS
jgi:hypothetical protein